MGRRRPLQNIDVNAVKTAAESAVPEVIYVDLPVIASRQGVLANDFFDAGNFRGFRKRGESASGGEADMSGAGNPRLSGGPTAAAAELELIAIVNGKKPQAFIGDKHFEKGQGFRFAFGGQVYNFKVVNILEDRVELECNGVIITKKIPESSYKAER